MEEEIKPVNPLAIPLEHLPEGWRETAAAALNVSVSTVSKVANGTRKNDEVFDFLLELALKQKEKEEAIALERAQKLEALLNNSQPVNN